MYWVVQKMNNEYRYEEFISILQDKNIDFIIVKVVPFYNKLLDKDFNSFEQDIETSEEVFIYDSRDIYVNGSTTLVKIAQERNWSPGCFINNLFDYREWRKGFGEENLLNPNSLVGTVTSLFEIKFDNIFVRSVFDDKAIPGTVMSREEYLSFRNSIINLEEEDYDFVPLHKNSLISISETKEIYSEVRLFVVDNNIIAGSTYKINGKVKYSPSIHNYYKVRNFVNSLIEKWVPCRAFVIDIAYTPNGYKVIEINNINSSGFYDTNIETIVDSINNMKF